MKQTLVFLAALSAAGPAIACRPNVGGVLVVHDANLTVRTTASLDCQAGSVPGDCTQLDTQVDAEGPTSPAVFRVYAAFPPEAQPRLVGVCWGINYDPAKLEVLGGSTCSDFELPDAGWPQPGTGTTEWWNVAQLDRMTPMYVFAAYTQDPIGGTACVFELGPSPSNGGYFGDDCPIDLGLTEIFDYGKLGFHTAGYAPCFGACCNQGSCRVTTAQQNCAGSAESWLGPGSSCTPNPCSAVPVDRVSWGRIKSRYR